MPVPQMRFEEINPPSNPPKKEESATEKPKAKAPKAQKPTKPAE
tara:strand:- start:448 stop:579 length:132 start_codon:yes stop_codon:yes gene_type:complete